MSAEYQRNCLTAVLLAARSELNVTAWARRLPAEGRRQVRDLLARQKDQRAVNLWQAACDLADSEASR